MACFIYVKERTRAAREKATDTEKERGLHMTNTWLRTSAPLTYYPDRLKTLKLGGSESKEYIRRKRREEREGGLNERDRVTKSGERGSLHEEKGRERRKIGEVSCGYLK